MEIFVFLVVLISLVFWVSLVLFGVLLFFGFFGPVCFKTRINSFKTVAFV